MALDYGKIAYFRFNVELNAGTLYPYDFAIVDDQNVRFVAVAAWLMEDMKTVRLKFTDFNAAHGICKATYTPGSLYSMAGYPAEYTEFSFTPIGLVPPSQPAPVPVSAYNAGNTVFVTFDTQVIHSLSPYILQSVKARFQTRTYAPDGEIVTVERVPMQVFVDAYGKLSITFPNGNTVDLGNAIGDITIVYDGSGGITAGGNPVEPFEIAFTPAGMEQKPDQMCIEHVEISAITAAGTLTEITYHDAKSADEHIEISGITAAGILTDIGDL